MLEGRDSNPRTPKRTDLKSVVVSHLTTFQYVDCVGLEPTDPEGRWVTATRLCRFANNPFVGDEGIEPLNCRPATILLTQTGFTDLM